MEDKCDEKTDSFKLKALEIVGGKRDSKDDTFTVSQIAGENCWKLQALI
jgi:hypothetical protein